MKKLEKRLRERGIARYTIYKLDKPFPFYLLDLNKLNISRPYYASFFKYITIEFWGQDMTQFSMIVKESL